MASALIGRKYFMDDIFKTALQKTIRGRFKQKDLAERVNISVSYFNDLFKGRKSGQETLRRAIASALGYEDYESFLDVGRRELGLKTLSIAGSGAFLKPVLDGEFFRLPFFEYPCPKSCLGNADKADADQAAGQVMAHGPLLGRESAGQLCAFRIEDNSMEPLIAKGGIALVDLGQNIPGEIKDGGIYLVSLELGGPGLVRRLKWVERCQLMAVESEKGSSDTIYKRPADINLLGRVIWTWREHA